MNLVSMTINEARHMTLSGENEFRLRVIESLRQLKDSCIDSRLVNKIKSTAIKTLTVAESYVAFSCLDSRRKDYLDAAVQFFRYDIPILQRIDAAISVLLRPVSK